MGNRTQTNDVADRMIRDYLKRAERSAVPADSRADDGELWLTRIGKSRMAWPIAFVLIALSLLLGWLRG